MTGLLSSCNIRVSQQRVRQLLIKMSPQYHSCRVVGAERHLNSIPYNADYFGQSSLWPKWLYGVTHVIAVDGYSGMILGAATMLIKNCIEIYKSLFR